MSTQKEQEQMTHMASPSHGVSTDEATALVAGGPLRRYRYPHPTQPGVFVSRQRIYQLRRVAEGRCSNCAQALTRSRRGLSLCDGCNHKHAAREYARLHRAEAR